MKQNLLFSIHADCLFRMTFVAILFFQAFSLTVHGQNIKTLNPQTDMTVKSYSTADWSYTPEGDVKVWANVTRVPMTVFNEVNGDLIPGFGGTTYLKYNFDICYVPLDKPSASFYFSFQFSLTNGVDAIATVYFCDFKVPVIAMNHDLVKDYFTFGERVDVGKLSFSLAFEYTVESANSFTTRVLVDGNEIDSFLTTFEGTFGLINPSFSFSTYSSDATTTGGSYMLFKGIDYIPGPLDGVDETSIVGVTVYSAHNRVYIKNEGNAVLQSAQILDMAGQVVYSGEAIPEIDMNVAAGYYLVRLISSEGAVSSFKVYLTR
ncbi:MAG: hypothetical protein PUB21_11045 [Bacteroidales bacterium]|nr:hypothetical protein [Bacteroidales bacterium]